MFLLFCSDTTINPIEININGARYLAKSFNGHFKKEFPLSARENVIQAVCKNNKDVLTELVELGIPKDNYSDNIEEKEQQDILEIPSWKKEYKEKRTEVIKDLNTQLSAFPSIILSGDLFCKNYMNLEIVDD